MSASLASIETVCATGRIERWSASMHCPICDGHSRLPHGRGIRCWGYLSNDGQYAYCTRGEYAGSLSPYKNSDAYPHCLQGECGCGLRHGDVAPVAAVRSALKAVPDPPVRWRIPDSHVEMFHRYELEGALQYELARFWKHHRSLHGGAKGFFRHTGSDGLWYFGQGKWRERQDKPLYRQEAALSELCMGGSVFITEGERDADALWDLGLIATTTGGTSSFNQHHAQLIIDAMTSGDDDPDRDVASMSHSRITIIADNDASGDGIKAGKKIYKLLMRSPRLRGRVDLVVMANGFKDVAEYLTERGDG